MSDKPTTPETSVDTGLLSAPLALPTSYADTGQQPLTIHHTPDAMEEMFQSISGQALRLAHVDESVRDLSQTVEGFRDQTLQDLESLKGTLPTQAPGENTAAHRFSATLDRLDVVEKMSRATNSKTTVMMLLIFCQFLGLAAGGVLFWQKTEEIAVLAAQKPPPPPAPDPQAIKLTQEPAAPVPIEPVKPIEAPRGKTGHGSHTHHH